MNDFLNFVNSWKVRAFEIDMVAGYANVAHILQQRQWDLLNAESPEEILAAKEVAKKALDDLKNKIRNIMLREGTLMAHDLAYVRMWFEYKDLFEKSEAFEKPQITINEDEKIEKMLSVGGFKDVQGLQQHLSNKIFKPKILALMIYGIAAKCYENYNVKSFLRWMSKEDQYKAVHYHLKKDNNGFNKIDYAEGYHEELKKLTDEIEKFR